MAKKGRKAQRRRMQRRREVGFSVHTRTSSGSDGDLSLSGETFTVEAMEIAKTEGCDVVAVHEFFWTDAGYAAIRQIT